MTEFEKIDPREGSPEAKIGALMRDIRAAERARSESPEEQARRIQAEIDSFSEIRPDLTHQLVKAARKENAEAAENLLSPYDRRMTRTGMEDDAAYETRVSTTIKAAINNSVRTKPEIDYPVLAEIAASYLSDAEKTRYSSENRMGNIETTLHQLRDEEGLNVETEKLKAGISSTLAKKVEKDKE